MTEELNFNQLNIWLRNNPYTYIIGTSIHDVFIKYTVPIMSLLLPDWIRQRALSLELRFIRWTAFLERIPLLRYLHRNVTADIDIFGRDENVAIGFRIKFITPYLNLPVAVDKTQIGSENEDRRFTPTAFRFFDWHSWAHIEGKIDWEGARTIDVKGTKTQVITGFVYTISDISVPAEHYGLRLAEGVDGTARVLLGGKIERMKFEPVYWMLEPTDLKHNVVAIYDNDLMALIVSLSSIGSGNRLVYNQAIAQLEEWIAFKLARRHPEKTTLAFLRYVRDWGPLRMEPLFYGLKEVLDRLQIPDLEKIYFEYYADNCGVGDNRYGRLLAVNMLEAMGTRKAHVALLEIYKLSKNQDIQPEELKLIKKAIRAVAHKKTRIEGGAHKSFPVSGAIREKTGLEKPPEKPGQSKIVTPGTPGSDQPKSRKLMKKVQHNRC